VLRRQIHFYHSSCFVDAVYLVIIVLSLHKTVCCL